MIKKFEAVSSVTLLNSLKPNYECPNLISLISGNVKRTIKNSENPK